MASISPKKRDPRPKSTAKKPATQKAAALRASKRAKASPPPTSSTTKLDAVIAALRGPKGATITDLMTLTGWQMHSVRGAIAGALKKKRGLPVQSDKIDGARVYRLAAKQ